MDLLQGHHHQPCQPTQVTSAPGVISHTVSTREEGGTAVGAAVQTPQGCGAAPASRAGPSGRAGLPVKGRPWPGAGTSWGTCWCRDLTAHRKQAAGRGWATVTRPLQSTHQGDTGQPPEYDCPGASHTDFQAPQPDLNLALHKQETGKSHRNGTVLLPRPLL